MPLLLTLLVWTAGCNGSPSQPVRSHLDSAAAIPARSAWTERGRVIAAGESGEWDVRLESHSFTVVKRKGTYLLYYVGADGSRESDGGPANRALGVAYSDDGLHFTKYPDNPVLTHQPDGGHGNRREEGIFTAAASVLEGGTVLVYFGGMESDGPTTVDADAVLATSPDGLRFTEQGDVLRDEDPGLFGARDEIFPLAVHRGGDGWSLYYTPGGGGERWNLGMASGSAPDDLSVSRKVLDLEEEIHGAGGVLELSDRLLVLPIWVGPWNEAPQIQMWVAHSSDPGDLSGPVASYSFPDMSAATVLLDRETGRWLMYYIDLDHTGIYVRTAPVRTGGGEAPG